MRTSKAHDSGRDVLVPITRLDREIRMEHTDSRIRGYLAAVLPLRGGEPPEAWYRGRALIERMALHSEGYDDPAVALSSSECADVLQFVACSEPVDPTGFFDSTANPSPQVGQMIVLRCVADHLSRTSRNRRKAKRRRT